MPPKPIIPPAYSSNVEIYADMDSAGLTPRTPFSRQTAQLEEGRAKTKARAAVPVNEPISEGENEDEFDEIDLLQTQSHPLLHSESNPVRSTQNNNVGRRRKAIPAQWPDFNLRTAIVQVQRIPIGLILGCGAAFILVYLTFASMKRKDALLTYMGVNTTMLKLQALDDESRQRFNTSTVIDYSTYSSFPLKTEQYATECWKIVNDPRMKPYVPYWDTRPGVELDVLHQVNYHILFENHVIKN